MDNYSTIERGYSDRYLAPQAQRNDARSFLPIQEISKPSPSTIRYSICTLVTNMAEYTEMVRSFMQAGFDPSFCEFLYLDNSKANRFDAFRGYNHFLHRAQGEFVILCHQDILLYDDRLEDLERCMRELDRHDPNWAVFGNAGGGLVLGSRSLRITDPEGDHNSNDFPSEVSTLDENFIVVRRAANLSLSRDLSGYHLYGTDLCLVAKLRGYKAWVVDFNLFHKSRGNCDASFKELKKVLTRKYCAAYKGRYIETTCTRFYISGYRFQSLIFETGFVRSMIKRWNRFKRKWGNTFHKRRAAILRVWNTSNPSNAAARQKSKEPQMTLISQMMKTGDTNKSDSHH
jgi:hypothetical protein